ncbi:hypothetical protein CG747_00835 [Streptomyces sp. CB02959]|nr:hypothetical protein CG747_00835 [Streptomyces sp. CB02959]
MLPAHILRIHVRVLAQPFSGIGTMCRVDLVSGLYVAALLVVPRLAVGVLEVIAVSVQDRARLAQPLLQHVVRGVKVPLRAVALFTETADPLSNAFAVLVAQVIFAEYPLSEF